MHGTTIKIIQNACRKLPIY